MPISKKNMIIPAVTNESKINQIYFNGLLSYRKRSRGILYDVERHNSRLW